MKLAHKIDNLRKPALKREFSTKWIFAESNVKRPPRDRSPWLSNGHMPS
jgi:hypothetical protein